MMLENTSLGWPWIESLELPLTPFLDYLQPSAAFGFLTDYLETHHDGDPESITPHLKAANGEIIENNWLPNGGRFPGLAKHRPIDPLTAKHLQPNFIEANSISGSLVLGELELAGQPMVVETSVEPTPLRTLSIFPSTIDPLTDQLESIPHYITVGSGSLNKLLVWLPGTQAAPSSAKLFLEEAAGLGYHVVGVAYPNTVGVNSRSVCGETLDSTCAGDVRQEINFGQDVSPLVSVDVHNAIVPRLTKLLNWLHTNFPDTNFGQFLNQDQPMWDQIVLAGHSQGAGHAAYLAKQFSVDRVALYSWSNDQSDFLPKHSPSAWPGLGDFADWIYAPQATPGSKWWGFIHTKDTTVGSLESAAASTSLGFNIISGAQDIFSVDGQKQPPHTLKETPYPSQFFVTALPPQPQGDPHNTTIYPSYMPVDASGAPLYTDVWEQMLMG